jgi:hypothetical protein
MNYKFSRRKFLTQTGLATAGIASIATALPIPAKANTTTDKQSLMHLVLYYLKNPGKPEEKQQLINGLKELVTVKQIKSSHVGVPMDFKAEDPLKNYHVSLLMVFEDKGDIDIYHKDPIHQKFVKECGGLWTKTVKYDSLGG